MIKSKVGPLINLSIRAFTLLGKFILLFFMAKFLTLAEVGVYGLLVVLISYSLYAVGFDFYTYSTREIINLKKDEWGSIIKKQGQLILGSYFIVLPVIIVFSGFFVNHKFLFFLAILIILEHLNQELMRLLIVDGKAVLANNLLFLRSGLWCYVVILLMFSQIIGQNLENILLFWAIFNSIALLIGGFYFFRDIEFKYIKNNNQWLIDGLKICLPLLFSTLIVRVITTVDRIWLEKLEGIEVVAVYALFVGLTNSLISFLETGVFSFVYPKLIAEKNNKKIFKILIKKMCIQAIVVIVIVSGALVIFLPFLLKWVNKEEYFDYYNIFYVILIANIFYCLSMIPHYILYAKKEDRKIIISHFSSLIVFVISTLIIVYNEIPVAIAYGLCCTFIFMFFIKSFFSLKEIR